ncbi:MAG: type II toxin-antitoxin system HicB family antitoxin [Dehalococcoidales bacterium]|nr:type II toxin-antitoxin system HicB family antitoxin [Dehalococcoidales bacterium]
MSRKIDREELEYYLNLKYPVLVKEDPDGGYTAEIEELNGCMTQAETTEEAFVMIEDARRLWIEAAYAEELEIPLPRDMQKYTGKFLVRIPGSLHKSLVVQAKNEGVSLNQYVSMLLASGVTRDNIKVESNILPKSPLPTGQMSVYSVSENGNDYTK